MAYRQKKKNVGTKIFIWFLLLAMVASTIAGFAAYLIK